ncbi:MAG: GxxExxY protein [Muribaculaceae bacterium]|nr:GxxExxY protein [Muribaculaceae bacterium]
MDIVKYKDFMYDVVGAIHEVHKELGAGLNEFCYQEGFAMQLIEDNIPFEREFAFHPTYHGKLMNAEYRLDFLCKNDIVVECKAVTELVANHRAQLFNYMRLLKKPCGILVNFSPKFATIERYLYDSESQNILTIDGRTIN